MQKISSELKPGVGKHTGPATIVAPTLALVSWALLKELDAK
jgi:hypothetical protein